MLNENLREKVKILDQVLGEIPELVYLGDPILRKPTEEIEIEEGKKIGERLSRTLVKYREIAGFGRGLAAPQIGENKSVFVTYVNDQLKIFINPEILDVSEETNLFRELCLSSTLLWADVKRYEWIALKWFDEEGKEYEEKFDGFMARLIQHEHAHLQGVPNLDEAQSGTIEVAGDPLAEKLRNSQF